MAGHTLTLQFLQLFHVIWISSYLSNLSQFVCYNEFHSDLLNISCGVPQGSILGPKLFILYINDLCNISRLVKYILFADDTNLFCADKNINQLVTTVSTVLDKLCIWFAVNKLSLNVSKTSYMLFGNSNADFDIATNGISINRVRVAKFLGVLIDEKLNWKNHIANVKSKLSKSTAILYKCSQVIDSQSMHIIYSSFFYHTFVIVLKYGETHILLMSIVLLYFKREQLDFCLAQGVLTTQLLFSIGRIY